MEQAQCRPGGTGQQGTCPPRKPPGFFSRVPRLVVPLPRVSLEGQCSGLACLKAAHMPQPWPQPHHAAGAGGKLLGWMAGDGCSLSLVMLSMLNPREDKLPEGSQMVPRDSMTNRAVPYFPGAGAGSYLSCWEGVQS